VDTQKTSLKLASKLGIAQECLSIYEKLSAGTPWTKNISVEEGISTYQNNNINTEGVVLLPLLPLDNILAYRTFILAHLFRYNGYEPAILCENMDSGTIKDGDVDLEKKKYLLNWYMNNFNIKCQNVTHISQKHYPKKELVEENINNLRNINYRGSDISGPALATLRRYLKRHSIDLDNENIRKKYISLIKEGIAIANATHSIVEKNDVDICLSYNTYYIYGRLPLDICHNKGINSYTQETGYSKGKLIFGNAGNRQFSGRFINNNLVNEFLNENFSESKEQEINALMKKRQEGRSAKVNYNKDTNGGITTRKDQLVGIFSHLPWDGALEPEGATYSNFYYWLEETLNICEYVNDTEFVLKIHPAERIRGTNESVTDWLDNKYTQLPENITILESDTDVNTYDLINDMDAGLVYASTVGLEAAFNGTPVVVGGNPPYKGFGITYDPEKKSRYEELVRDIHNITFSQERELRAKKFAYLFFISNQIHFPYLENFTNNEPIKLTHTDIVRNHNSINNAVNQMIMGQEVIKEHRFWK
jgi:hypothetical protein